MGREPRKLTPKQQPLNYPERCLTVNDGGVMWLAAVNLILWSGLFLYLLSLERKIRQREKDQ